MAIDRQMIWDLLVETPRQPRQVARYILNLQLSASLGWTALALMAVGSALISHLGLLLSSDEAQAMFGELFDAPLRTAGIQLLVMAVSAQLAWRLPHLFGGQGEQAGAVVLVAWLQFVLLLVQAAQLVAMIALPILADMLGLLGIALFFWLMSVFIAEMHGFKSALPSFFGVIVTTFVVGFVMMILFVNLLFPALIEAP